MYHMRTFWFIDNAFVCFKLTIIACIGCYVITAANGVVVVLRCFSVLTLAVLFVLVSVCCGAFQGYDTEGFSCTQPVVVSLCTTSLVLAVVFKLHSLRRQVGFLTCCDVCFFTSVHVHFVNTFIRVSVLSITERDHS